MQREKEKEEIKRRDLFLHISDAELLGNLPVDGQVNQALYDEVKKKQEQLKQLQTKNEKEIKRRDELEEALSGETEKRNRLKRQIDANGKLLENEEHLAKLMESEKKRISKELVEMKIKLYDKNEKVKALRNLCESQRKLIRASPYTGGLKRSTKADRSSSTQEVNIVGIKKALEHENKNAFVLKSRLETLKKHYNEKVKDLNRIEQEDEQDRHDLEQVNILIEENKKRIKDIAKKRDETLTEIEGIRKTLNGKEIELSELQRKNLEIAKLEENEKRELDEAIAEMEKIVKALSEKEKEVAEIDEKLKACEGRWEELQDVLSKMDSDVSSALATRNEKVKENEDIEKRILDLECDASKPTTSKNQAQSRMSTGDSKYVFTTDDKKRNVILKLQREVEQLEETNEELNSKHQKLEKTKHTLEAKIEDREKEKETLESNITSLNEQLEQTKQFIEEKKQEEEEQSNKIEKFRQQLIELEKEETDAVKIQKSLSADLRNHEQTLSNYTAKLNSLNKSITSTKTSIKEERKANIDKEKLAEKIKRAEKELKTLEEVLAKVNDKNKMVRAQLTTVRPYNEEQSIIDSLKAEESKLKKELQTARAKQEVLQIKNDRDIIVESL